MLAASRLLGSSSVADRGRRSPVCVLLVLVILVAGQTSGCGPGRRAGGMRRRGKLTPLVFKQHYPNLAETTLAASGSSEGRIERGDRRFKDLVENLNTDIVFRDEERTGADRMMTQRCKDKLNTLAISVMNQWPGVKLRVTEAWDEERIGHAKDSLHYEGRAVDITTSDRDRTKYGMLARLAVEAGFDWVYYESRAHIHCSVKSDSSIATKNGGCFPKMGRVYVEGAGTRELSDISVGDRVLSVDAFGRPAYDDVIMFFHRDSNRETVFVVITTHSGKKLTLTATHLVHVSDASDAKLSEVSPIFARGAKVGQYLHVLDASGNVITDQIVDIGHEISQGIIAPLTEGGNIIVDDVIVSCYAVIESENIAHAAFAPIRFWYSVSDWLRASGDVSTGAIGSAMNTSHADTMTMQGVHWYADWLFNIAPYLLPSSWLVLT